MWINVMVGILIGIKHFGFISFSCLLQVGMQIVCLNLVNINDKTIDANGAGPVSLANLWGGIFPAVDVLL